MNQNKEIIIDVNINDAEIISSLRDITRELNRVISSFNRVEQASGLLIHSISTLMVAISSLNVVTSLMARTPTQILKGLRDWKGKLILLGSTLASTKIAKALLTDLTWQLLLAKKATGTAIGFIQGKLIALDAGLVRSKALLFLYNKAIAAWGVTKAALIPIIGLVTGAVKTFSTVLAANPIGAVILGVTLLVAAIVGAVRWFNRGSAASSTFRAENERTAETLERLNDRIASNRQAHEDNIRSINVSNHVNRLLIESLKSLKDEENLSVGRRAEIRNQVDQLNNSMEGLNLVIDEETGLLTESSQALLEQAALYNGVNAARSEAESILERLNQAQAESVEKQLELEIIAERRARIEADQNMDFREREFHLRELNNLEQEIIGTKRELTTEIEILGGMYYDVYTQISETTSQFVEEQAFAYENLSESQREVVDKLVDRWTMYRDNAREMFSEIGQETKLWAYETDEYGNQVRVSMLETGDTQENVMQAMIDNMRNNRLATAEWSDNLDELAYRTSEEFAQHMREMGVGSAAYVAAMLSDCHDLLYELAAEFEMGGYSATDNISRTLGEGGEELAGMVDDMGRNLGTTLSQSIEAADFESIGMMLPAGLTRGVADGTRETVEAVSTMSTKMQEAVERLNGINSPSRVYMEYGTHIIEGLCRGIDQMKSQVIRTIEQVARDMKRVYNNANRDYTTIGRDVMNGLNQGLLNGENSVMSTARRIADNIARTMRNALDINSPSRIMREEIGRQIPAGIAAGIDKYAEDALDSVYDLGQALTKVSIPKIKDIIGMGPGVNFATVSGAGTNSNDNSITNNYEGMFKGANFTANNEQDVDRIMQLMARKIRQDRMSLKRRY